MFDDLRALYSDTIRQHGRHPTHVGPLDAPDGVAKGDNPMCGDRVEVFVKRLGDTLAEASFVARGCEISLASADLMCEAVAGLAVGRIRDIGEQVETLARTGRCEACDAALERLQPLSAVHDFPSRVKCVTLPWRALMAAIEASKETAHD